MSATSRVLLGLGLGIGAGIAVRFASASVVDRAVGWSQPIGDLWLSALRMTVVPLVISLLITGVASAADVAATGRLAMRALIAIILLLGAGAFVSALTAPAIFALLPFDSHRADLLRSGLQQTIVAAPPLAQWISGIIPSNVFKAAADGAMVPLVVFSLLFGFALTRLDVRQRQPLLEFFQSIANVMLEIVRWVLLVAPIGIFALVLPIVARGGGEIVGAIGSYVLVLSCFYLATIAAMYPLVAIAGGVSARRFARAATPAQAVAVSTQSSLASLPAMIDGAKAQLGIPWRVIDLVLPLAVAVFRMTSPIGYLVGAAFVARLYGVHLSAAQYAAGVVVSVVISMGAVGLPGQVSFMATHIPVFQAMGLPLDPLALLLAVDTIPDVFCTAGNVTADLAVTAIVARRSERPVSDNDGGAASRSVASAEPAMVTRDSGESNS
jgi:Na+/H+-dicarboxylate symporter